LLAVARQDRSDFVAAPGWFTPRRQSAKPNGTKQLNEVRRPTHFMAAAVLERLA
jgi:hypothetical protein